MTLHAAAALVGLVFVGAALESWLPRQCPCGHRSPTRQAHNRHLRVAHRDH